MRLILVRHGETAGRSSIRFYGKTDIPLSDEGIKQMESVGDCLDGELFHMAFSSPLSRSYEGAKIIQGDRNIEIYKIEEFIEINFGRWEGLTLEEIKDRDEELFYEWRRNVWNFDYPEGDKRKDFIERVRRGVDRVLEIAEEGSILLVLHKGILRVILNYLLDNSEDPSFTFEADLGSIHELERVNGKWFLKKMNYTDHLIVSS